MILRRYRIERRRRSFGARIRTRKTLLSERKVGESHARVRKTYRRIERHFARMGIGEDIMELIMSTPNDKIRWLTPDELRATKLATDFISGEEFIAGAGTATPTPAAKIETMKHQDCGKVGEWRVGCGNKLWSGTQGGPAIPLAPSPAELLR